MSRYRTYFTLDSTPLEDGDNGFTGFASKLSPDVLAAGICSMAENARFDKQIAQCRKGIKLLNDGFSIIGATVILPLALVDDIAVTSITRTSTTATVTTATDHGFVTDQMVEIDGAVETAYNGDFQITVTGTDEFTYSVAGSPSTPATGTITANGGPLLSNAYENGIFTSGIWSNPSETKEWLVLASGEFAYFLDLDDGTTLLRVDYPSGQSVELADNCSIAQALNKLIIFRGPLKQPIEWEGDFTADFTSMASTGSVKWNIPRSTWGVYYANRMIVPLEFINIPLTSITRSSTVVTVTTTLDHGLSPGVQIVIGGCTETQYNGTWIIATVPTSATFTFAISTTPSSPATGSPYLHYLTRDELIFSDSLDVDTYDSIDSHFRINKGAADWLVGVYPWVNDQVLVFFRHSIWVIAGASDPSTATVDLVTGEIGLSARRSMAGAGTVLFFLSSKNIYKIESGSELNLRWLNDPLSRDIDDIMDRVNEQYSHLSVGIYHNNRYYLAVPIDGETRNNAVIVFNLLNNAWESIDYVPEDLRLDSFVSGLWNGQKRLFGTSFEGGVFLMEENEYDQVSNTGDDSDNVDIPFEITTRRYSFGVNGIKKIRNSDVSLVLPVDSTATITPILEDPDSTGESVTVTYDTLSDPLVRFRISRHGRGVQLNLALLGGRPEIRSVTVEGYSDMRRTTTRS